MKADHPPPPGLGVDAHGGPVIDPTKNVLDLVEAAVTRLDDMTELRARLADAETSALRRELAAESRVSELRAQHQKDLDALEAKRLDAIRQVDQLAVKTEADRSAAAITALAQQAATTAETLRSAVNTSAQNLATQLTNTVNAITERIASLEKSSYVGQGRQAFADPAMADLVVEMKKLSAGTDRGAGKSEGISMAWAILLGLVALIGGLYGISGRLTSSSGPPAAVAPQVIYVPAPAAGSGAPLPGTSGR